MEAIVAMIALQEHLAALLMALLVPAVLQEEAVVDLRALVLAQVRVEVAEEIKQTPFKSNHFS